MTLRSSPSPSSSRLEKLVLLHVGVLLVASSWVFGGNIWWMRVPLAIWASAGLPLAVAAFMQPGSWGEAARRKAWWLAPLVLFAVLVVASSFNPSFQPLISEGAVVLVHKGAAHPAWPSTVNPTQSLLSLWFGSAVYLSAFNLVLTVRSRTALRVLLVLVAVNTLVLAVLGTVQKLSGSGFYFGAAVSPNSRFFGTFIYNNHWGAFMILGLCTAMGLVFHHVRKNAARDLWHSPFSIALTGVLFIAATAPLSASRAATGMAALVVGVATIHALVLIAASRRHEGRSTAPAIGLVLCLVLAGTGAIGWLGFRSISERYRETHLLIEQNKPVFGGRAALYRDTWELASRQPVFGWGLDSYGTAFMLIRPRPIQASRQYESSFVTAHNDWLQSVAETGFAGTALLALTGIVPLLSLRRHAFRHPLVAYPALGCGLILLYALIEFPFATGAVLIGFCTIFFAFVRHAQLTDLAFRLRHD
jgi:O-antigen ligase